MWKTHSILVMALCKTKLNEHPTSDVASKFGFKDFDYLPCIRRSWGIWLLWNENQLNIGVIHKEQRFISSFCKDRKIDKEFIIIYAYAPANRSHKDNFLKELTNYCLSLNLPYLVICDLNEISFSNYKLGGVIPTLDRFKTTTNSKNISNTMDLPFFGNRFPWKKTKGS